MLPFMKNKDRFQPGLIVKTRESDEKPEETETDDQAAAIESCAEALIHAVHAKDVTAAAQALKDAFDILDSMPHEEGPHTYEAQNIKAGQEEE